MNFNQSVYSYFSRHHSPILATDASLSSCFMIETPERHTVAYRQTPPPPGVCVRVRDLARTQKQTPVLRIYMSSKTGTLSNIFS